MARPLRINYENAVYHIFARGNRKEDIFYSDEDKRLFQEKMNKTFQKYSLICYAYCLLDNHYHLFLKTPKANLSKGMHYLNVSYANYFSARYRLSGALFQGRYKSISNQGTADCVKINSGNNLPPLMPSINFIIGNSHMEFG
jgi:REP element-mobilizing transposase RayT